MHARQSLHCWATSTATHLFVCFFYKDISPDPIGFYKTKQRPTFLEGFHGTLTTNKSSQYVSFRPIPGSVLVDPAFSLCLCLNCVHSTDRSRWRKQVDFISGWELFLFLHRQPVLLSLILTWATRKTEAKQVPRGPASFFNYVSTPSESNQSGPKWVGSLHEALTHLYHSLRPAAW